MYIHTYILLKGPLRLRLECPAGHLPPLAEKRPAGLLSLFKTHLHTVFSKRVDLTANKIAKLK